MYSVTSNVNKVRQPWSTSSGLFSLRRQLLYIDAAEATFTRRRFHSNDDRSRKRLEAIGTTFLLGYIAAIEENDLSLLAKRLSFIAQERRGFAFEGAAMGLTLLDALTPWNKKRLLAFINGEDAGAPHVYMAHVGSGWAIARLPWLRW